MIMNLSRRIIKITLLALLAIFLAIVSYQAFSYWNHRGLSKIEVILLPNDSQLRVDGAPAKAGTIYLKPGTHTLSATRQYFDKVVREINTRDIKPSETIYMLPEPNSAEAKKWLAEHPDVQLQRESVGGAEAIRQQAVLTNKYPILEKLPHENSNYKIDYALTPDNKLEFTINLFGSISGPDDYPRYQQQLIQSKAEALQYLQGYGISPQDYKITYIPNI